MKLRQIEYALAVADHGGFSAAARAIHVAQPSLSQAIHHLEGELGVSLFVRAGRTVTLSHAGEAFLGPARRVLREVANLRATVGAHAEVASGCVDVVALPTLAVDPLVGIIGRFRRAHPGVSVRVVEPTNAAELRAMVRDGRAELGLTDTAPRDGSLLSHDVGSQELLAVLPPDTSTSRRSITMAEFAALALVLGPPGASIRQVVEQALAEHGLEPQIAVEIAQREAVVPLVVGGVAATALPEPLARDAELLGATVLPFAPALVRPVTVLCAPTGLSPAAAALLGEMVPPIGLTWDGPRVRRTAGPG